MKYLSQWERLSTMYSINDRHGKTVPFVPNYAQTKILSLRSRNLKGKGNSYIICVKARQLGITTGIGGIWLADTTLFTKSQNVFISYNEKQNRKIMRMIKHLDVVRGFEEGKALSTSPLKLATKSGSTLDFALTPRGDTITNCHITELSYLDKNKPSRALEVVTATLPAVSSKGSILIESTARGSSGQFHSIALDARNGGQFSLVFLPWWTSPEYTTSTLPPGGGMSNRDGAVHQPPQIFQNRMGPETLDLKEKLLRDKQTLIDVFGHELEVGGIPYVRKVMRHYGMHCDVSPYGGIALSDGQLLWWQQTRSVLKENMLCEYPSTFIEAFAGTSRPFYDFELLEKVVVRPIFGVDEYIRDLTWYVDPNMLSGKVNLLMGIDLAEGLEHGDYTVIRVRDNEGHLICSYRGKMRYDEVCDVVDRIYSYGVRCVIAPERNNHGHAFLVEAKHRSWYSDIWRTKTYNKVQQTWTRTLGWHNNSVSRSVALDEHEMALREGEIEVDAYLLTEMMNFCRDEQGVPRALPGYHDDVVLADAICWQMRKYPKILGFTT